MGWCRRKRGPETMLSHEQPHTLSEDLKCTLLSIVPSRSDNRTRETFGVIRIFRLASQQWSLSRCFQKPVHPQVEQEITRK
jgi:hypothetical protein